MPNTQTWIARCGLLALAALLVAGLATAAFAEAGDAVSAGHFEGAPSDGDGDPVTSESEAPGGNEGETTVAAADFAVTYRTRAGDGNGATYTVTYSPNGGEGGHTDAAADGESYTVLTDDEAGVSRTGFDFLSWNTDAYARGDSYAPGDIVALDDDLTLYAQWQHDGVTWYHIIYEPGGGTGGGKGPETLPGAMAVVTSPESVAPNSISRKGFIFQSWNTEPNGSGTLYMPGDIEYLTGKLTLYAQWKVNSSQPLEVTYNPGGGSGEAHTDDNLLHFADYTFKDPTDMGFTRTGYTFTGWNTAPDGTGRAFDPGEVVELDNVLTLYARWAPNPHTVTYYPGGGVGDAITDAVFYDDSYPVRSLGDTGFTRTGYNFIGWNTAANGSGHAYAVGEVITIAGDVVLYAQWQHDRVTYYHITYDPGGGTGGRMGPNTLPGTIDTVLNASAAGVSRWGYHFLYWRENDTTTYYPGDIVTLNSDSTLYAQWQYDGVSTFILTYDAGGGEGGYEQQGLRPGDHGVLDPGAVGISRYGYTFTGWWTEPDGGDHYNPGDAVAITDNRILYAGWAYDFDHIDVGLLSGTPARGGAGDTAWHYDATAQLLTLQGAGPYALTGASDHLAVRAEVATTILMDGAKITAPAGGSALYLTGGGLVAATGDNLLRGGDNLGGAGGAALSSGGALTIDLSGGSSARMRSAALFAASGANNLDLHGGSGHQSGAGLAAPNQPVSIDVRGGHFTANGQGEAPGIAALGLVVSNSGGSVHIAGGNGVHASGIDVTGDVTLRGNAGHALYDSSGRGTSVHVDSGTLTLEASQDGINSDSALYIGGDGSVVIESGGDGVSGGGTQGVDLDLGGNLVIEADGHGIVSDGPVAFYQAPASFSYITTSQNGCAVSLTSGNSDDLIFRGDSGSLSGAITANEPGSVIYRVVTASVVRRARSGSAGVTAAAPTPAVTTTRWIIATEVDTLIRAAQQGNLSYLRTMRSSSTGIAPDALGRAAGYRFDFDSLGDGGVAVRLSIPDPTAVTGNLMLMAHVDPARTAGVRATFAQYFANEVRIIYFEQQEPWGQRVSVAAKLDLTSMDVANLVLYSYNPATNRYTRIADPAPWVDASGYLCFTTTLSGAIVVSDGALVKK